MPPSEPEYVLGEVFLGVFRVGQVIIEQRRPLRLEGVRDVFEENDTQGNVLVVGRLHDAAKLVRRGPELGLELEIGAVVVRSHRHVVLDRCSPTETQFAPSALQTPRPGRVTARGTPCLHSRVTDAAQ